MFNSTNLDEVCVQDTHIESKGNNVHEAPSVESNQEKEGKEKGKGKHATTMKKEEESYMLALSKARARRGKVLEAASRTETEVV